MNVSNEKIRRSLLFVPGSRPERFEKACQAGADMVCIDLEDAVAPDMKDQAREAVLEFLCNQVEQPAELGLRINSVTSAEGTQDLQVLPRLKTHAAFIMVPKVRSVEDIDAVVDAAGQPVSVMPVMESGLALLNATAIFSSPHVHCALFGGVDYSADIDCTLGWDSLLYPRSHLANAAAAYNVTVFDVPYLDVKDDEGLIEETHRVQKLGISARAAIHPAQIAGIHKALRPSNEAISRARRIVDAFESGGGGVALLDGKLIELPVIKAARRTLEIAQLSS